MVIPSAQNSASILVNKSCEEFEEMMPELIYGIHGSKCLSLVMMMMNPASTRVKIDGT